jgi:hypothetical protein
MIEEGKRRCFHIYYIKFHIVIYLARRYDAINGRGKVENGRCT